MMKTIACAMNYGKSVIHYELRIMDRKSLEIAVHPDKRVVVKAPSATSMDAIQKHIEKRARWIKKQLTYFSQFEPRTPPRQYVGGESHLYLGRKYRLKISSANRDQVLLKSGYFYIQCVRPDPTYIRKLLEAWYRRHAFVYFTNLVDDCWDGFDKAECTKPKLKIQQLKTRWGSLSRRGQLTLNTELVKTPKECIEYVIMHELCHLKHHNHGREFYKLLDRTMPDWLNRKHKLEMALV